MKLSKNYGDKGMMVKSSRKKMNCGKCGRMNLPKMISKEVFIVLNRNGSVVVPVQTRGHVLALG